MNLLIFFFLNCFINNDVLADNSTACLKQLFKDLLSDYDPRLRPVNSQHDALGVYVQFVPTIVLELNTALQRLALSAHFGFSWTDGFLQWNLTDSDGIDKLRFPVRQVWHPTVTLSMSHNGRLIVGNSDDVVGVTNNGSVSWMTEGVFRLVCEVNIEFYPFDTQECKFNLYISDLTRDEVILLPYGDGIGREYMMDNPEWHIQDMKTETVVQFGSMQLIEYTFLFQRRASFMMYTTIGPLIILAFLNATAFLVPIESGEKGSIVITILLSFCVYMSSTSMSLPPNSMQNSNLLTFMTILEANSAVAVLYTMIESYMYADNGRFLKILNFFRFMKCCKRPEKVEPESDNINMKKLDEFKMVEEPNNGSKNNNRSFDILMFVLFLMINIVVIGIYASKVRSNVRENLTDR